jgi:hypothetical protein
MKRITHDPKQARPSESPARTLADRNLRAVRGGSSVIKPELMAQIASSDD